MRQRRSRNGLQGRSLQVGGPLGATAVQQPASGESEPPVSGEAPPRHRSWSGTVTVPDDDAETHCPGAAVVNWLTALCSPSPVPSPSIEVTV
jgi:hypothetical protein